MEKSAKRQLDQECLTRKKQKPHYKYRRNTDSNGVVAISGIRVEEEEKMMFSWGERSRAASQEEETTILQKNALQRKLEKISSVGNILLESSFKYQFFEVSRCGIKSRTEDVEHCLSTCVKVRLHGLISKLIKMSKKKRSLMLSTAEVQHCIIVSNHELWKKKIIQDKAFRGEIAANVDMNKDIKCAEPSQENKMKRTAYETLRTANSAARAAAGWDDIISKWKFIDKPEWKKQDASSSSIHQESTRRVTVKGLEHKISIKDIIALLERETLLSKSTLNYCLCNR